MSTNKLHRLTYAQMEGLVRKLRETNETSPEHIHAQQRLTLGLRGFIVNTACHVANQLDFPVEDLINEGITSVIPWLKKFEPGRAPGRTLLPGYITKVARDAMMRYVRESRSTVRVTRHGSRKASAIRKQAKAQEVSVEQFLAERGHGPESEEHLACFPTGRGVEYDSSVENTDSPYERALSLAAGDPDALNPEQQYEKAETALALRNALQVLSPLHRKVVDASFGLENDCEEGDYKIAKALKLKPVEVARLRAEAMAVLREKMAPVR